MELYLPIAEMSVHWLLILGMGAAVGFLSGVVRRRRRLPADPAADLRRDPAGRRGGDHGEPGLGLDLLRRDGALAPENGRSQDGRGDAGRRPDGHGAGRLHLRPVAGGGPIRIRRLDQLCGAAGIGRQPDAGRKHPHHSRHPQRQEFRRAQAGPAQLDSRPALQAALPPLAALYLRVSAGAARLHRRRAVARSWASAAASSWCR